MSVEFFNIEAEQAILGTIILNNEYLNRVEDVLMPEYFYELVHQKIYAKILNCIRSNGMTANQVTLKQFFDSEESIKEVGGALYLSTLLMQASVIVSIRDYAYIVKENFAKRKLLEIIDNAHNKLLTENLNEICDEIVNEITKLDSESREVEILNTSDMATALKKNWELDIDSRKITTGLVGLNKLMNGGLYPKKLYIIGAAAGVGKTSFAQQIISHGLHSSIGCAFFSMEMERENVLTRFLGSIARINPFRIAINKFYAHEHEMFASATKKWAEISTNFFMSDKGSVSVGQMRAALKRLTRKNRIGLVVVDYVQIMPTRDSKNTNEATLIKENVTALKELAKEFNIAVVGLSQIVKEDVANKPTMKSLKGSGGIAEGADFIALMWQEGEADEKVKPLKLAVVKNRNGSLGEINVNYDGEFGIFTENNNF